MSLQGSLSNLPIFFTVLLSIVQSDPKTKSVTRSVLQLMRIDSELIIKEECTVTAFCKFGLLFIFIKNWFLRPIWVGECAVLAPWAHPVKYLGSVYSPWGLKASALSQGAPYDSKSNHWRTCHINNCWTKNRNQTACKYTSCGCIITALLQ